MTVSKTRYTWYTHKRSRRVQVAEIRTTRDPTAVGVSTPPLKAPEYSPRLVRAR